jgi:hypothetical protein
MCGVAFRCAVTQTLRRLFLKGSGGVLIPSDFSCFAAPAHCPRAHALLNSLHRSFDQPYIMSLTDGDVVWGPLQPLWRHASTHEPRRRFEGTVSAQLSQPLAASPASAAALAAPASEVVAASSSTAEGGPVLASRDQAVVDGMVGFFTSTLYGALHVDSRPKLHTVSPAIDGSEVGEGRNAMHWEAFYFPLKEPLKLPRGAMLKCSVAQVTFPAAEGSASCSAVIHPTDGEAYVAAASDEMWYEWAVEALASAAGPASALASADAAVAAGSSATARRGGGRQHRIKLGSDFVPKGSDIPAEDSARLQLAMLRQNAARWKHSYLPAAAKSPEEASEKAEARL